MYEWERRRALTASWASYIWGMNNLHLLHTLPEEPSERVVTETKNQRGENYPMGLLENSYLTALRDKVEACEKIFGTHCVATVLLLGGKFRGDTAYLSQISRGKVEDKYVSVELPEPNDFKHSGAWLTKERAAVAFCIKNCLPLE